MMLILIAITIRDVLCSSALERHPNMHWEFTEDSISDVDWKFGIGWQPTEL